MEMSIARFASDDFTTRSYDVEAVCNATAIGIGGDVTYHYTVNPCRVAVGDDAYFRVKVATGGVPGHVGIMAVPETEHGLLVSNHIDVDYSNFSAIVATKAEKMLLLASAWRLGDDYYQNCESRNVDLAGSDVGKGAEVACAEGR